MEYYRLLLQSAVTVTTDVRVNGLNAGPTKQRAGRGGLLRHHHPLAHRTNGCRSVPELTLAGRLPLAAVARGLPLLLVPVAESPQPDSQMPCCLLSFASSASRRRWLMARAGQSANSEIDIIIEMCRKGGAYPPGQRIHMATETQRICLKLDHSQKSSGWQAALNLQELGTSRSPLLLGVARYQVPYAQSVLGVGWAIIQPVLTCWSSPSFSAAWLRQFRWRPLRHLQLCCPAPGLHFANAPERCSYQPGRLVINDRQSLFSAPAHSAGPGIGCWSTLLLPAILLLCSWSGSR